MAFFGLLTSCVVMDFFGDSGFQQTFVIDR